MATLRVLITDADTLMALAIVRSLGFACDVWTAAPTRSALAACSRFTKRHLLYRLKSDTDLTDWILEVCKAHDIQIVIPPEESSSLILARTATPLKEHGIHVAALPIAALESVVDKTKTADAAR